MNQKSKIISVTNQKGGVGKTTTTINLATAMVSFDQKILIVDLDPQGNASTGLGIPTTKRDNNIYKALTSQENINNCIYKTIIPDLEIIPTTIDLSATEVEFSNLKNRESVLQNKLNEIKNASILSSLGYFYGSITKYLGLEAPETFKGNSKFSVECLLL